MSVPGKLEIDFTSQQLELLDRLAVRWGTSREVTVQRILEEALDPDQGHK